MNDRDAETELWSRVADAAQPDEKKRRGLRAALERYYQAVGLLRESRRNGPGDEPVGGVEPVDPSRRII